MTTNLFYFALGFLAAALLVGLTAIIITIVDGTKEKRAKKKKAKQEKDAELIAAKLYEKFKRGE